MVHLIVALLAPEGKARTMTGRRDETRVQQRKQEGRKKGRREEMKEGREEGWNGAELRCTALPFFDVSLDKADRSLNANFKIELHIKVGRGKGRGRGRGRGPSICLCLHGRVGKPSGVGMERVARDLPVPWRCRLGTPVGPTRGTAVGQATSRQCHVTPCHGCKQ